MTKRVTVPEWFREPVERAMREADSPRWPTNIPARLDLAWRRVWSGQNVCRHCKGRITGAPIAVKIQQGTKLWHASCYDIAHPPNPWRRKLPAFTDVLIRHDAFVEEQNDREAQRLRKRARDREYEQERKAQMAAEAEQVARYNKLVSDEIAARVDAMKAGDTCDILAGHHDLLKDDPERLPTDFLRKLIGRADPCPDEQV